MTAAESGGLIRQLDYWVIDQVCRQIAQWREQELAGFHVAINVSGKTLADENFPQTLRQTMERHQTPGAMLMLELTEAALLQRPDLQRNALKEIQSLGVGIAIDNFGTGHSSLASLQKLSVRELKIDGRFVARLAEDPESAMLARTIVAMGRSLGIDVVAEGVETREQLDQIQHFDGITVQGYLYSQAVDAEAMQHLLIATEPPAS